MPKTITIDSLSLGDLHLVQTSPGHYRVNAIYTLQSSGQVVTTVNQEVTGMLDAASLSALGAAVAAVQAAVFAAAP